MRATRAAACGPADGSGAGDPSQCLPTRAALDAADALVAGDGVGHRAVADQPA